MLPEVTVGRGEDGFCLGLLFYFGVFGSFFVFVPYSFGVLFSFFNDLFVGLTKRFFVCLSFWPLLDIFFCLGDFL